MTLGAVSSGVAVAALASRFAVGLIFLAAGAEKLFDTAEFERAVADYQLVPRRLVGLLARSLPLVELFAGSALLAGVFVPAAGLLAAGCLVAFSVAVGINLVRGRAIDCGCGGVAASREIGWDLVAGDLLLAAAAVFTGLVNVTALEPMSLPRLISHAAPFAAPQSLAILAVVGIGVLLRALISGYVRLRKVMSWVSATQGGMSG
jgi:hypothetical protein